MENRMIQSKVSAQLGTQQKEHPAIKKWIVIAILLAVTAVLMIIANIGMQRVTLGRRAANYVSAQVETVILDNTSPDPKSGGRLLGEQQLRIKILQGPHKGEHMQVQNLLSALHNVYAQKGTRIVVQINTASNGSYTASIYNYDRFGILLAGMLVVLAMLCVVGGRKGVRAMLGIVFTILCVLFLLLPLVLQGVSAIGAALLVVVLTTGVSFALLDGVNGTTVSATVATIAGALFSAGAAALLGLLASLNGFNMQEAETLMLQSNDGINIPISGLLVAGILISAHGAVMDVAISIAASIDELHRANPNMDWRDLFRSGMRIGQDTMGTMVNTLILAFVGSSLNFLLIIYSYGIPFGQLINTDLVGVEFLQGIAGCVGIILTVPLVAIVSAVVAYRRGTDRSPDVSNHDSTPWIANDRQATAR